MLKTVVATFLSLVIDAARPGAMPFYAAITAIICTQKGKHDSFEMSVNREISTIIGGLAGMGFLYVELAFRKGIPDAVLYAFAAVMLVPLISFSIWLERPKTTFLMCVVFLSVVISHGEDAHPFFFALNRIVDTTIGIVVALVVNLFPWKRFHQTGKSA